MELIEQGSPEVEQYIQENEAGWYHPVVQTGGGARREEAMEIPEEEQPGPSHRYNLRKRAGQHVHSPKLSPVKRSKKRTLTKQRVRKGKSVQTIRTIQRILDDMEKDKTAAPSMKEIGEKLAAPGPDEDDPYKSLWKKDEHE